MYGGLIRLLTSRKFYIPLSILAFTTGLYILYRFILNISYRLNITRRPVVHRDVLIYGKRISAFIIFGVFPIIIVKYIFHESLHLYGFALIHNRVKPIYFLIMLAVVLPIMIILSKKENINSHYPEVRAATFSKWSLLLSSITYIMYYFGYEGLFRGFLVFGLRRYTGDLFAVVVSMIFTSITHLNSPFVVLIGSVVSGVIFPYIVILSGSIWALFIFHSIIGVSMDIFCARENRLRIKKQLVVKSN